jgi:hypothetical protein
MANTFVALSQTTLTQNTSTVNFTNISQDYTDLMIYFAVRTDRSTAGPGYMTAQYNDSIVGYPLQALSQNPADPPYSASAQYNVYAGGYISFSVNMDLTNANTFSNGFLYIGQYTSNKPKLANTVSNAENNDANLYAARGIYAFKSTITGAITKISFTGGGANLMTNSSFYIYGIKNS